jgi:hypothetical protein
MGITSALTTFLQKINQLDLGYNLFMKNCQHFVEIMFKLATGQVKLQ